MRHAVRSDFGANRLDRTIRNPFFLPHHSKVECPLRTVSIDRQRFTGAKARFGFLCYDEESQIQIRHMFERTRWPDDAATNQLVTYRNMAGFGVGSFGTAAPSADLARRAMRKAGNYWATKVASHGGYVWEYTTDFVARRRGESGNLPLTTNWVQPPGTPSVGMAFLRAFEVTGERSYLDAAVAAAHCLAWGQLASGGWTYSIEFDLTRNRNRYHHLDARNTPRYDQLRDVTTFDDNTTQSATRLLMAVDQYVDDPIIDAARQRALECFLTAQYKDGLWDGAWPQRYPPRNSYGAYPTFNDNTMSDCVRTMLVAAKQYGDPRYMESVKRCIEFYLRSQLPAPQAAWAQQYDENLKPAWARKFEPPAVTGGESSGNMQLLMDMYIEFGDPRYLDAVGRAIDWYRRSRIGGTEDDGIWARFYELGSNKPLYFTRTYELVYAADDLPVHYSFKSNYGVDSRTQYYQQIRERGRDYYLRSATMSIRRPSGSRSPRVKPTLLGGLSSRRTNWVVG